MLVMGRGKHEGVPKKVCAFRLSEEVRENLENIGGEQGITAGFMKVYDFFMECDGLEQSMNTDRGVVLWMHKSIRKPVAEGLQEKFLVLMDLWINSGCEDMSIIKIYAAIGSSKGNGAAAKKTLKQLVDGKFILKGNGGFRPNIIRAEHVSQAEFDIKFDRYISIVNQPS